ncbi:hypothetical protein [Pseudogemmobacter faecipullorum]|uniref:Uncharacterized protein n=1 Tax=Pseudogemmobacter faecipullorum TaxID=2755041 RepID=A0ABS8CPI9_9RHOB|nr:hypothetical protein [Pseudogemmobacter faecipullorum]MCB5411303.1 hypothetical protein [Pseudogemmobacter faecipullorum]
MLLPFMGTSLIAKGVMPVAAADGAVMLVICSGGTMTEIAFDPVTMEPVPDAGDRQPKDSDPVHCVWAGSHPAADAPLASSLPARITGYSVTAPHHFDTVLRMADATGLPPATGPPHWF